MPSALRRQAPIERLDNALSATMTPGTRRPFDERDGALEPVLEQVFRLDVVAASIGLSWLRKPDA
jgi:hypothetical protein